MKKLLTLAVLVTLALTTGSTHAQSSHPAFNLEVQDCRVASGEEPQYLTFSVEYTNAGAPVVAHVVWGGHYSGSGLIADPRAWNVDGLTDDGAVPLFGNGLDQQETQITYECFITNGLASSSSGPITVPVP